MPASFYQDSQRLRTPQFAYKPTLRTTPPVFIDHAARHDHPAFRPATSAVLRQKIKLNMNDVFNEKKKAPSAAESRSSSTAS
ncbi:hypothetical protein M2103_000287 [Ereboglobus sp. PH5-5]|uniref:hypothetical protein n=1 Tax=unclassified Ereboglobus TaxID=2626932 RepID=UPI002406AAE8|nr:MULTISPECIES: hypothetical protein [unclassified Ereboglobus]MDF9826065.1 hypothetical protein [Ereboglobus sp. PH5-10]MDF9832079.1 hypothetical protein [Ereboglobus sp. PH5-5]